jgi:hypothetical protein
MMKALLLALLVAYPAAAAEKKQPVCREGKSFFDEIYNCGQNKLAAQYAEKCANASLSAVKAAGAALAAQMEAARKTLGAGQASGMNDARSRLQITVNALGTQIVAMQKSAALIADYPKVMIDYPDAKDDETSAGCFSPAFNKIQDIVTNLDQEILKAKQARSQAKAFLATLGSASTDMRGVAGAKVSNGPGPASAPKGPKGKNWNASDISGTKPDPKK